MEDRRTRLGLFVLTAVVIGGLAGALIGAGSSGEAARPGVAGGDAKAAPDTQSKASRAAAAAESRHMLRTARRIEKHAARLGNGPAAAERIRATEAAKAPPGAVVSREPAPLADSGRRARPAGSDYERCVREFAGDSERAPSCKELLGSGSGDQQ